MTENCLKAPFQVSQKGITTILMPRIVLLALIFAAINTGSCDEKANAEIMQRLAAILTRNAPPKLSWHYEQMLEEQHSTIFHPAALKAFRTVFKPAVETR
ncbi:MAG: hypothetical protein DMF61_19915 [Blastocatellia bacterium AA13]|nr:MAG: hypothetical protein DMF61_19915 [Blastocatellia bacterium AA13]